MKKNISKKTFKKIAELFAVFSFGWFILYVVFFSVYSPEFLFSDMRNKFRASAEELIYSEEKPLSVFATVLDPPVIPIVTGEAVCSSENFSINLDWPNDQNSESFDIIRDGLPLASDLVASQYADTGIVTDTYYAYKVIARGPMGPGSAESELIIVFTPEECNDALLKPKVQVVSFDEKSVASYNGTPSSTNHQPIFSGTTNIPNANIHLSINSGTIISADIRANINGYWIWIPPVSLSTRTMTLIISATDPLDALRTVSGEFIFIISEEDNEPDPDTPLIDPQPTTTPEIIDPGMTNPDVINSNTDIPEINTLEVNNLNSEDLAIPILSESNEKTIQKTINLVLSRMKAIVEQPIIQKALAAIATGGVIVGSIATLAVTNVASALFFPVSAEPLGSIARIFSMIGIFGPSKKKKDWGVVFDKETRRPIAGAMVSIMDKEGRIAESVVTNAEGRYGFLAKEGEYTLQISKKDYNLETQENRDEFYGDIYTGEMFKIKEDEVVKRNIALKSTTINWQEFARKKIATYNLIFSIIKTRVFKGIFYLGFLISAIIMIFSPSIFNAIILVVYMVQMIYRIFFKTKSFGTITNELKNPVPFAIVSLYSEQSPERRIAFAVSDVIGRYYLLADDGSYLMKVQGQQLDGQQCSKTMQVKVEEGVLKNDVVV